MGRWVGPWALPAGPATSRPTAPTLSQPVPPSPAPPWPSPLSCCPPRPRALPRHKARLQEEREGQAATVRGSAAQPSQCAVCAPTLSNSRPATWCRDVRRQAGIGGRGKVHSGGCCHALGPHRLCAGRGEGQQARQGLSGTKSGSGGALLKDGLQSVRRRNLSRTSAALLRSRPCAVRAPPAGVWNWDVGWMPGPATAGATPACGQWRQKRAMKAAGAHTGPHMAQRQVMIRCCSGPETGSRAAHSLR